MMNNHIDSAPAVEPLAAERRREIKASILDEIDSQNARTPRRRPARVPIALAAVAVLGAGGVAVATFQGHPATVTLASAVGTLPVSTAECSPAQTSDPRALQGATYLLEAPTPAQLTDVWMTVDECPRAAPVAAFVKADASTDDAALTVWGGDAESSLGSLQNFANAQRVSLGSDPDDAWLVDFGWGVWIEWQTDDGSYLVTSAGLDRDAVVSAAASYRSERSAAAVGRTVAGLEPVSPLATSDRDATWYVEYGEVDPAATGGDPWVRIEVSPTEVPWAVRASVNPVPDGGLTPPTAEGSNVRSGDNGGFRFANWTTETGAQVQLMSNLSEAKVRELVGRVEVVPPSDPQLSGFDLTTPRTGMSPI